MEKVLPGNITSSPLYPLQEESTINQGEFKVANGPYSMRKLSLDDHKTAESLRGNS